MKRRAIAGLLAAVMVMLTGCARVGLPFAGKADDPLVDLPKEVVDTGDFSAILTYGLTSGDKNDVVSPLSAYVALAMAAQGADGETRKQFESVLGAPTDDIAAAAKAIGSRLLDLKGSTKMNIAQSVWTDESITFSEAFLKKLSESFAADVYSGRLSTRSMRDAINRWASDNTNGLIDPFLTDDLEEGVATALINALYFKGKWAVQFEPHTFKHDFTGASGKTAQTDFMYASASYKHIDNELCEGAVLPYDDGKTCFVILMPKSGTTAELAGKLPGSELMKLMEAAPSVRMALRMPSFTVESSHELKETLIRMGLADAFTGGADFSRMSPTPMEISSVLQKAKIIVDTEGTEAAAVTAVIVKATSALVDPPLELTFDRPFFYAVMDMETAIPLFTGVYNTAAK